MSVKIGIKTILAMQPNTVIWDSTAVADPAGAGSAGLASQPRAADPG
jgi:hypothetical protein